MYPFPSLNEMKPEQISYLSSKGAAPPLWVAASCAKH